MGNDISQTPKDCSSCIAVRGTLRQHSSPRKLLRASGPLEIVTMDILGPLPKTPEGYQYVLVVTDCFSKRICSIPTRTATGAKVTEQFPTAWVCSYGIPTYLLTDNGLQLVAKFFEAVCGMVAFRSLLKTAYHPQTNGHAKCFNRTLVTHLRHYV